MKHPRTALNGRGQSSLDRPAAMNSGVYALVRYARQFSPLHWRKRLPVMLNDRNIPPVPSLFLGRSPSAIVWAVPLVGVYPVDGVCAGRCRAHVEKERLETTAPLFAHTYPPASVKWVVSTARVGTPPEHQSPSVVLLCGLAAIWIVTLAVFQILGSRPVFLQAPTRRCVPRSELVGANDAIRTARAMTLPSNGSTASVHVGGICASAHDDQATEYLTGKINESWHFFTLKWLTVMGAWQAAVNSFSGATLAKQLHFSRGLA